MLPCFCSEVFTAVAGVTFRSGNAGFRGSLMRVGNCIFARHVFLSVSHTVYDLRIVDNLPGFSQDCARIRLDTCEFAVSGLVHHFLSRLDEEMVWMDMVICAQSALDYWRSLAGAEFLGPSGCPWDSLREPRSCDDTSRSAADALVDLGLRAPLDLLYPSAGQRRTSSIVRGHAFGNPLPDDELCRIGPGLYVCSPRAAFCQLSTMLDGVDLLLVGLELCGTFVMSPASSAGFLGTSSPLLGVDDLREVISWDTPLVPSRRKKLERVVNQLAGGSNSPAESAVFTMFTLPTSSGGLMVPGMLLNEPVVLEDDAARIAGCRTLRPDFYYPAARTVGEYKSRMFHPEGTWTNDDRRLDAFASMGLHTFSLNNERVKKLDELVAIGRTIAGRMGKRAYPPTSQQLGMRRSLHRRLFSARGPRTCSV